jgi:hypothetical protein
MNTRLMPFYFGAVEENERLEIERELLSDPEVLLDYLDLKRKLEAAGTVPQAPSPFLWKRLAQNFTPKQKRAFAWIAAAAAAAFVSWTVFHSLQTTPDESPSIPSQILFDRGGEQSAVSNVI